MTTLLVAEDDPDMRDLIRSLIAMDAELTLCAMASDGEEAMAHWTALDPKPDVVLTDNQMPRLLGIEVAARILEENPDQVVIMFSAYLDAGLLEEAARIGVARCIQKDSVIQLPSLICDVLARTPLHAPHAKNGGTATGATRKGRRRRG